MGKLLEYLQSAIKQIMGNGYRTLMTMLGIIIGIAAVIAVVALGNGMTDYITVQFDSMSGASGIVNLDTKKTMDKITPEDMQEVKMTLPDINGITPTFYPKGDVKVKSGKGTFLASLTAKSEGGLYSGSTQMATGKYFNDNHVANSARVVVMLDTDAKKLFGTTNCIGMTVEITIGAKSAEYSVIGLRENKGSLFDMLRGPDAEYYAELEIPYTSYGSDFGADVTDITSVEIYASTTILKERTKQACEIIGQNHGIRGTDAISYNVFDSLGDSFASTLGIVKNFLMLVSAISLLVGGIGVMNIMLVSVTERTREIGIRKSIGARTEAIMVQFLAESALITLMGGIIGVFVGIIIAYFICKALTFKLIIEPSAIIFATAFSIFIGIFFGLYPARKAAKMKPIDALRT